MTNYVVAPSEPTDEMVKLMLYHKGYVDIGFKPIKELYLVALSAAPTHNLIALDKRELDALVKAANKAVNELTDEAKAIEEFEDKATAQPVYGLIAELKAALAPFNGTQV